MTSGNAAKATAQESVESGSTYFKEPDPTHGVAVQMINWITETPLRAPEKAVLLAMARYAWTDYTVWPSQDVIGKQAGVSLRCVVRVIKRLSTLGYIQIRKREMKSRHGYRHPNEYDLNVGFCHQVPCVTLTHGNEYHVQQGHTAIRHSGTRPCATGAPERNNLEGNNSKGSRGESGEESKKGIEKTTDKQEAGTVDRSTFIEDHMMQDLDYRILRHRLDQHKAKESAPDFGVTPDDVAEYVAWFEVAYDNECPDGLPNRNVWTHLLRECKTALDQHIRDYGLEKAAEDAWKNQQDNMDKFSP